MLCEPRAFAVGKSGRYSGNRVFHIDIRVRGCYDIIASRSCPGVKSARLGGIPGRMALLLACVFWVGFLPGIGYTITRRCASLYPRLPAFARTWLRGRTFINSIFDLYIAASVKMNRRNNAVAGTCRPVLQM